MMQTKHALDLRKEFLVINSIPPVYVFVTIAQREATKCIAISRNHCSTYVQDDLGGRSNISITFACKRCHVYLDLSVWHRKGKSKAD